MYVFMPHTPEKVTYFHLIQVKAEITSYPLTDYSLFYRPIYNIFECLYL